jgi:NAD(P)-dependent dehydrogenase (short-subunit alcohol dehydrogenase family)
VTASMSGPLPAFRLDGRVALITGASRGIGAAIAECFAAAGATVVLSSRKQAGVDEIAAAIRATGGAAHAVAAHTGDRAALEHLMATVDERCGRLDIVVNNAATNPYFGPLLEAEESHWTKTLDVNLLGYWRTVQAAQPLLAAQGGKVINIASVAGLRAQPNMGLYSVSKAAVIMLTQVLAAELATHNIQVNAIAPGYVETRFSQAIWADPDRAAAMRAAVPQGRFAQPAEFAGAALYLASPTSSYTTGAVLVVDGGQLPGSDAIRPV